MNSPHQRVLAGWRHCLKFLNQSKQSEEYRSLILVDKVFLPTLAPSHCVEAVPGTCAWLSDGNVTVQKVEIDQN